jgi:photosystem II stability/assembly factor-like uncharacterized protein
MRRAVPVLAALASLALLMAACTGASPPSHVTGRSNGTSTTAANAVPTTKAPASTTTTGPPVAPTTEVAPPAPLVDDLTWVSDTHGWALVGQGTCGQTTCADVLTTTDGGSVWTQIGSIAAALSDCAGCGTPGVSHIRFANDLDGYAFGPDLFVTTDGGITWSQEDGRYVAALESAGSTVMRVAYTQADCPGPCDLTVQTAPAGTDVWRSLTTPFQGDAVQLVRQGPDDAYVAVFENPAGGAQSAHVTLMISDDAGATWSTRADPCVDVGRDEYDTSALAAAPGPALAVLCQDRMQSLNAYVAVSRDGGAEFAERPLIPAVSGSEELAMTSASSIFVAFSSPAGTGTTQYTLLSSDDGGGSWQQAARDTEESAGSPPPPDSTFLGFESSVVGRWVVGGDILWQTADGGGQWVRDPSYVSSA